MKKKLLKIFIALVTIFPIVASAGIISLGNGNITSDTNTTLIVDHLNQREYLRFDILGATSFQEQVALTTTGDYKSFSIADHQISFDFINSILNGNIGNCTKMSITAGFCNILENNGSWSEGDLGFSYESNYDYWLFENNTLTATHQFGLAGIRSFGTVYSYSNWGNESEVNLYGNSLAFPIHLLMYRDIASAVAVPEPKSLWLLVVAILILPLKRLFQ